jgi:putative ABC transport system permease protein
MNLKLALRNIRKNKGFSIINIASLALGITCFLLLLAYVYHELNYDKYLPNSNRVSMVTSAVKSAEDKDFAYWAVTPTAIAPLFKKEFPEVENAARMYSYISSSLVQKGNESIKENGLKYVDEDFLNVLNFKVLKGNATSPLANPNDMVLTEKLAKKYFSEENPIGKTLVIDKTPWTVTAVIEDLPTHTEINFTGLLSNKGLERYNEPSWGSANDLTFILFKENANQEVLQTKVDSYFKEIFKNEAAAGITIKINLENIRTIHLHSKAAGSGNMTYIYIFGFLGIALLIISAVNFTNLSLSHATERAKEIGVRKVLGAHKKTVFNQFIIEGGLMVGLSVAIGLIAAWLLLPVFSTYLGLPMKLHIWKDPYFYLYVFLFFMVLNFLASGWPAWIISNFKPINIIKGQIKSNKAKFPIAKVLITFQYCISIFLVICTLIALRQMHFIQSMDTGLNRSQILVLDGDLWNNVDRQTFKNQLVQLRSIKNVSASYDSPVNIQGGYSLQTSEGKQGSFTMDITALPIEKDFLTTFQIPILAGSTLNDNDIIKAQDTSANKSVAIIINKLAAEKIGWTPEEAIGKTVNINGRKGPVKAVVDNFNFASLREEVRPIALFPEYAYFGNLFIKLNAGVNPKIAIQDIESVFKKLKPNTSFNYHFLDDDYAKLYRQEQQTTKTMQLFAMVTICIACIGLFAISAYAAQQRVKEIGIRKVLGASVNKLVGLLTSDFIKLVFIAFLITVPLGYWAMDKWLNNFAYHIHLEWWIFVVAGIITLVISFMTIGGQAFKAAKANPVDSLRDE